MRSFSWAFAGIFYLVRTQRNAWVHLLASVGVIGVGIWVGLARWEWCWMVGAIGGVWVAEALNTAIEILCDVVCVERNDGIGRVKDLAAGAVLMAAVGAAVIGVVVFWPHVF